MTVALYSRGLDAEQVPSLQQLLFQLHQHNTHIVIHHQIKDLLNIHDANPNKITFFNGYDDLVKTETDALISIGGDGTILDAVTLVRDSDIPILGINFGRLGFLASLGNDEINLVVEALVNRTYIVDKRTLLHTKANLTLFGETPFGLNEFVIHKQDTSPMIKIHTYLNGEFLNTYWADGLIVSTPTGSTGYNLSCNGPIVFPDAGTFIITPVAPHNLNVRPIVVPDTTIVSFEIEGRSDKVLCTLDARRELVDVNVQVAVKKEAFTVSLIRLNENNFLSTLRNKLTWGMDKRN